MSDRDEQGSGELERQLDAAFRATRPRRGFEDELWARLLARRPWWRRLGGAPDRVAWGGVAAGLTALLVVGLLVTLLRISGPHGGSGTATSGALGSAQAPAAAQPATSQPSRADTAGAAAGAAAGLPFGPLPAPSAAGVVQVVRPSGPSALPSGAQRVSVRGAGPAQPAAGLAVYRYDPAAGPADGAILETSAVPAGLAAGIYQSRSAGDAIAGVAASASSSEAVVLTQARLVYVAVVSGGQGFLEPAYLYTGTAGSAPAQVLVSALAPSALR